MNMFPGMNTFMPGADPTLTAVNRNLLSSGQGGFWGGNNGFWSTSDGNWFNPGGMGMGMGMGMGQPGVGSFGSGYAPMGYEDLMPRAEPLGIYRTYAHHSDEVVLTMRDPETSTHRDNYTVVDKATGTVLFSVKRPRYATSDKRNVFDLAGNWLFQIRRKGLPFTNDTWIGVDPMNQSTIFSVGNKHGQAGGVGITFYNTAGMGEQVILRIGGDMYGPACRFTDSHGQTVARLNKDVASLYKYPWNTQNYNISVAGHVDTSLMVAISICLDERMSRVPGVQR